MSFEVKKKTGVRGKNNFPMQKQSPILIVTPCKASKALRNPSQAEMTKLTVHIR